jgi:uncharacterized protein YndB with AHSA1/START domain
MSELELTVNRRIAAPREKVFNAWLSPVTLAKFMRASSDSTGPSDVSTDAVKGGRFFIFFDIVAGRVAHYGTNMEKDTPSPLAFKRN